MPTKKKSSKPPRAKVSAPVPSDPQAFIAEYVALLRELAPAARDSFRASVLHLPTLELVRKLNGRESTIKDCMEKLLASAPPPWVNAL